MDTSDYYERMKLIRNKLNTLLLPWQGRVEYVGTCCGALNVTWYFGAKQTGFAAGASPEAVLDRIEQLVFGGL